MLLSEEEGELKMVKAYLVFVICLTPFFAHTQVEPSAEDIVVLAQSKKQSELNCTLTTNPNSELRKESNFAVKKGLDVTVTRERLLDGTRGYGRGVAVDFQIYVNDSLDLCIDTQDREALDKSRVKTKRCAQYNKFKLTGLGVRFRNAYSEAQKKNPPYPHLYLWVSHASNDSLPQYGALHSFNFWQGHVGYQELIDPKSPNFRELYSDQRSAMEDEFKEVLKIDPRLRPAEYHGYYQNRSSALFYIGETPAMLTCVLNHPRF